MRTTHPLHWLAASALVMALGSACSKPAAPESTATSKSAPMAADGAITPDLSADSCKLLPPEQIESYKAAHTAFTSQPGLEPQFVKGQLFKDEETIRFKWPHMAAQQLSLRKYLLINCGERELGGSPLYETPPGSGQGEAKLFTNAAGSSYPDGTPAIIEISTLENIDLKTMTGKTVVQGRYLVRFNGPRD